MLHQAGPVNYKTVALAPGKHTGPAEGVCVMELASMLAGEQFSDHPRCVCPVIAAFLRIYNDSVDDGRRQDLYRFASLAVGTRGGPELERRRLERCLEWAGEMRAARAWPFRTWRRFEPKVDPSAPGSVARFAITSIGRHTVQTHMRTLAFVDELCAMSAAAPVREMPRAGVPAAVGQA